MKTETPLGDIAQLLLDEAQHTAGLINGVAAHLLGHKSEIKTKDDAIALLEVYAKAVSELIASFAQVVANIANPGSSSTTPPTTTTKQ